MKLLAIVVGAFGLVLLLTSESRTQTIKPTKMSDTRAGLKLSIEVDRTSYGANETARLRVTLQNVGKSPILVLKKIGWRASSGFSLAILDKDNNELPRTFIDDAFVGRSFRRDDFVSIMPGQTLQTERGVDLRAYGIKTSGDYQIIVWYRSPVSRKQAPRGLETWSFEKGLLVSKPVRFTVIDWWVQYYQFRSSMRSVLKFSDRIHDLRELVLNLRDCSCTPANCKVNFVSSILNSSQAFDSHEKAWSEQSPELEAHRSDHWKQRLVYWVRVWRPHPSITSSSWQLSQRQLQGLQRSEWCGNAIPEVIGLSSMPGVEERRLGSTPREWWHRSRGDPTTEETAVPEQSSTIMSNSSQVPQVPLLSAYPTRVSRLP